MKRYNAQSTIDSMEDMLNEAWKAGRDEALCAIYRNGSPVDSSVIKDIENLSPPKFRK